MQNEHVVKMAAKLYECRDAARSILGEKYPERMMEYGDLVRRLAAADGCGEIDAGTRLAKSAGNAIQVMLVMAATVEIIEPSNAELRGASRLHGEASLSNDVLGADAPERN